METAKVTRLRALRAARGLSYREITEITGVAKSTLLRYENKSMRIPRKKQIKLCDGLGVSRDTDLEEIVEINKNWLHGNSHTFND